MPPLTTATQETLLADRRWLRGLARGLVYDENRADDLEQQAWLAALDRNEPGTDAPRAWLGAVVRNWSKRGWRSDSRRRAREERAARPEALPSTLEVVERADLHRRICNAVFELDEPYRTTLLLRFFEDLPPREVARLTSAPVETVRTRIKRGLAQLRARLDASCGGDRRAWCVPLVALVGEPSDGPTIGAAATAVAAAASLPAAAGAGTGIGVSAAVWKACGLLVTAAVAVVAFVLLGDGSGADPDPVAQEASTAFDVGEAQPRRMRGAEAWPDPPPETRPPEAGAEPGLAAVPGGPVLRGRVRGDVPGEGGRVVVSALAFRGPDNTPESVAGPLREDGTFEIPAAEFAVATADASEFEVVVEHPDLVPATLRVAIPIGWGPNSGSPPLIELEVAAALFVTGRLVASDGAALRRADVRGFERIPHVRELSALDTFSSGDDGSFRLRLRGGARSVVAMVVDGHQPWSRDVTGPAGATVALGEIRAERSLPVSGRVFGFEDAPLGCWVAARHRSLGLDLRFGRRTDERSKLVTVGSDRTAFMQQMIRSSDDGGYLLDGLGEGVWEIGVEVTWPSHSTGDLLTASRREVRPPAAAVDFHFGESSLLLRLDRGRSVEPHAIVHVTAVGDPKSLTSVFFTEGDEERVLTRPGQRYRVRGITLELERQPRVITAPDAGTEIIEIAVADDDPLRQVVVRFRSPAGETITDAIAAAVPIADSCYPTLSFKTMQNVDGAFVLSKIRPGPCRLFLRADAKNAFASGGPYEDVIIELEVPETGIVETEAVLQPAGKLRITARAPGGGMVWSRLRLHDAAGEDLTRRLHATVIHPDGLRLPSFVVKEERSLGFSRTGPSDITPALPPGEYRVTLTSTGRKKFVETVELKAGETTEIDVILEPE